MLDFDPTDAQTAADPYPAYRRLREHDPVHRSRHLDGWVLTRHADVKRVLRDTETFANEMFDGTIWHADAARHAPYRRAFARTFHDLAPAYSEARVTALARRLADRLPSGPFDVVDEMAYPLPLTIVAEMLGLADDDHDKLRRWTTRLVDTMSLLGGFDFELTPSVLADGAEVLAFFVERGRRHVGPGADGADGDDDADHFVARLARQAAGISEYELATAAMSLLTAGTVNSVQVIGQAVHRLSGQAHNWSRLRRDPNFAPRFVEELVRHDPPVQVVTRRATRPVELGGVPIEEGDLCCAYLGAANRDPAVFRDPDRFDPDRDTSASLGFGAGLHACIGAAVAVREVTAALVALGERWGSVVVDPSRPATPNWSRGLRGYETLPVRVGVSPAPRPASSGSPRRGIGGGLSDGLVRARRTAAIAGFASRTAVGASVTGLRKRLAAPSERADLDEELHARTAREMLALAGGMRGAVMKFGQVLGFLDLGLPAVYQDVFQTLQSWASSMGESEVRAAVESDLGTSVEASFADLDWQPVAVASIGQVHRGQLRDGREVAVKVQYPDIATSLQADLANMEVMALLVRALSRLTGLRLDTTELAQEARERVVEETDYRREAANHMAFAEAYADDADVVVPRVVAELSGDRMLVTEWMDGVPWAEARVAPQELRNRWGRTIHRFVYQSIYRWGMFNADPHPGNYLFQSDGRVGFIDFGSVQHFDQADLISLRGVAMAIDQRDEQGLLEQLDALGYLDPVTTYDGRRLLDWLAFIYRPSLLDEEFTYTPEYAHEVFRRQFDPSAGWSDVMSSLRFPRKLLQLNRLTLGIPSVLAGLHASARWRDTIEAHVF